MKYYKDQHNIVFAYQSDGRQDHLIGNKVPLTQEEITSITTRPELTYAQKRVLEYPPIGDQLDALYHAGLFPEEMAAKILAVKTKYPKS
jgi:hypothetical protein